MAKHCINKSIKEYKDLQQETGLSEAVLSAKIMTWQIDNQTTEWPVAGNLNNVEVNDINYIVDTLRDLDSKLTKPPANSNETNNHYKYGDTILKRTSTVVDKIKLAAFPYLRTKNKDKSEKALEGSAIGTEAHKRLENEVKRLLGLSIDDLPPISPKVDAKFKKLAQSIIDAFPEGTQFLTEISVPNLKDKYASTIDLLAILPNKDVINVDYKTSLKKDSLSKESEFQYKQQAILIEKTLKSIFPKNKISSIILPIKINKSKEGKIFDIFFTELKKHDPRVNLFANDVDEDYLKLIASDNYKSSNKSVQSIIDGIDRRIIDLETLNVEQYGKPDHKDDIKARLDIIKKLKAAKSDILFNNEYEELFLTISEEIVSYNNLYENIDLDKLEDKTTTSVEFLEELGMIAGSLNNAQSAVNFYNILLGSSYNLSNINKDIISIASTNLIRLDSNIKTLRRRIYENRAERAGVIRPNAVTSPQGAWARNFRTFNNIDHPVFQTAAALNDETSERIRKELDKSLEELKQIINNFNKTNKGFNVFKKKDGNFISKFDYKKFNEDRDKAIAEQNDDWLSKNMVMRPYAIEAFKKMRERAVKNSSVMTAEGRNAYMETVDKKNPENISSRYEDDYSYYFTPSNIYFTSEYKGLNKEAILFYELYEKISKEHSILHSGKKSGLKEFFVPNSIVDSMFEQGWVGLIENIKLSTSYTQFIPKDKKTTVDGKIINELPNRFSDSSGNTSNYSNDLGKVLAIVMSENIRNKYYGQVEHLFLLLQDRINEIKVFEETAGGTTNIKEGVNGENALVDTYKEFIDYYVYDIRYKVTNPVFENTVRRLGQYFGANVVGLSVMANTVNAAASQINTFIQGSSGKYISKTGLKNAYNPKNRLTNESKFIVSLMDLAGGNNIHDKIAPIKSKGTLQLGKRTVDFNKVFSFDTFYKGFSIPENAQKNVLMIAFMNDNGYKDGKFYKLEGDEIGGPKSMIKMFTYNSKDNKVEISEELTKDDNLGLTRLRRAVLELSYDTLGSLGHKDIALINRSLIGGQAMMFKNWIPRMWDSRFAGTRYRKSFDRFDVGRYRSLLNAAGIKEAQFTKLENDVMNPTYSYDNQIANSYFTSLKALTFGAIALSATYIDYLSFGKLTGKRGEKYLDKTFRKLYQKFIAENPQFTELISEDEYVKLHLSNMQSNFAELSVLLAIMALTMMIGGADDDDPYVRVLNRLSAELTFFYNPSAFKEITRGNILPLWGFGTNIGNAIGGFYKWSTLEENEYKGDPLKGMKKLVPGVNLYYSFEYLFLPEQYKDDRFIIKKKKKGEE